ncbi:MAG: Serine/threonine-protein kinase pkn1 [Candidatus Ordinivivax streblomastigis]|uniref:Serine/threonine-protein kinase pkn1 n=1 Tax=Candidatus Ordinivivax streblomastigis TaxID=2540710 RepID=A0A5M8P1V4_9BACT|nr:MAG: Serine/threonine-protein kinase pkn1 [Candidatus Ordinivivax streblomastigis]
MKRMKIMKGIVGGGVLVGFVFFITSCGRPAGDGGELVGVGAQAWSEPNPHGMVLIKRGTFKMGPAENDTAWGLHQNVKSISIDNFWMDETEITNAEYRQFVYWVRDSLVRERLYDPNFGGNELFKITEDKDGNPIEPPMLDWKRPIPTEKRATEDELRAIHSVNYTNPVTGETKLDGNQVIYRYSYFDATAYALRRNQLDPEKRVRNTDLKSDPDEVILISKDTAYINDEGKIISETITRPLGSIWDFQNTYIINIYPDETAWVNDFNNAYNEPYTRLYFNHPGYDDFPVVGVSWEQARAFCAWRTEYLKRSLDNAHRNSVEPYRLPTEAEFEYAARSGKNDSAYPWKQNEPVGDKGCFLGNFKPGEGNYTEDGHLITSRVASYSPNEFGLYDMAGNVAEWTSTAYLESGPEIMNDINSQYYYNAAKEDPYAMKKKVVRGGSWKDVAHYIRSDIRSFEYQNEQRSYIGFRCVRTQVGAPKKR